jgi:hypothetical protein
MDENDVAKVLYRLAQRERVQAFGRDHGRLLTFDLKEVFPELSKETIIKIWRAHFPHIPIDDVTRNVLVIHFDGE